MKKLTLIVSIGVVLLISLACGFITSLVPTSEINETDTPETGATPVQGGLPKATATLALEATMTLAPEATIATDHGAGQIVFVSCQSNTSMGTGTDCGISIMNADGSRLRQLTDLDGDITPSLSPDGTRVAFVSDKRDGNYEIYVIHTDGSGLTRLTTNPGFDLQPSWSPDGSQIMYSSSGYINVVGVNGSNPHPVSNFNASFPRWSPDGRQILFETGDLGNILNIMDADGTHAQVIKTNQVHMIRSAVMSPDGSKIAFLTQKNRDDPVEVDVIDKDGKNQHSLTDGYFAIYAGLSWSPDGQQLIFTMIGDGKTLVLGNPSQLFFVNADGSGLHKLDAPCFYCVWADWGH